MFERRLRIFFIITVLVTIVLLLRAAHLQLLNGEEYRKKSVDDMTQPTPLETTRGRILDFKGRELAVDQACLDVAVDFRAIIHDSKWMDDQAKARLKARTPARFSSAGRLERQRLIAQETEQLSADLDAMWRTLARIGDKTNDQIDQIKTEIQRRVDWQRRYLWYMRYAKAAREHEQAPPDSWFTEWMLNGAKDPELDSFRIDVGEQSAPHVILHNISVDDHNWLKKNLETLPGVVLLPGKYRYYPYAESACHVLGHLSTVSSDDLTRDAYRMDNLRRLRPNDLIGRDGVEALCDQALRGIRGQVTTVAGNSSATQITDPTRGRDVKLTIDIKLQQDITQAFTRVEFHDEHGVAKEIHEAYGAAVVIDIPTGQVRALVSYPTFDLNRFQELYPSLKDSVDPIHRIMLNRATQLAIEPGSTVKPMVGIGAITDGIMQLDSTVECRGYLYLDGKRQAFGKCWVAKQFAAKYGDAAVTHHQIGGNDPHPTGFLTFSDAIQRSCNVFFENVGNKMGAAGLAKWYRTFGLGRKTGIGIPESAGLVPRSNDQWVRLFSAIGQTQVLATPLQMANVFATIARDGLWVRPILLVNPEDRNPPTTTQSAEPSRVQLELNPAAVHAAREGLYRVVNTAAGTGNKLHPPHNLVVAGKTGTAQAQYLRIRQKQPDGSLVLQQVSISTPEHPNPRLPWYRAASDTSSPTHAWFVCYVPADKPKLAIAVMLEYGGGGGSEAAPIARAVLDACVKHGYLEPGQ